MPGLRPLSASRACSRADHGCGQIPMWSSASSHLERRSELRSMHQFPFARSGSSDCLQEALPALEPELQQLGWRGRWTGPFLSATASISQEQSACGKGSSRSDRYWTHGGDHQVSRWALVARALLLERLSPAV